MPYIKDDQRISGLFEPNSAGQLNYAFTMTLQRYLNKYPLSYQTINDVIGALEATKLEFYRRVVVPYEAAKIEQNGDVYYVGQKTEPFPDPNSCKYIGWDSEGTPNTEHQYDADGFCIFCGKDGRNP